MTREEAIEKLHWFALDNRDKQIIDMAIEALTDRPKGLWTITTTDDGEGGEVPHLICSECGNEPMAWSVRQFFNFCPNCGADMRGEEE